MPEQKLRHFFPHKLSLFPLPSARRGQQFYPDYDRIRAVVSWNKRHDEGLYRCKSLFDLVLDQPRSH